ncbi:TolC family protein [Piscinibacter sakaiensis]|uniref:TolC family protein n=1 Tax=Piscinibacter sakaiensis TaxID=1547922 RepID=UPI00372736A2
MAEAQAGSPDLAAATARLAQAQRRDRRCGARAPGPAEPAGHQPLGRVAGQLGSRSLRWQRGAPRRGHGPAGRRPADTRAAEARLRPSISLSGSIGAMRVSGGGESASGSTWTLGPLQVVVPLFDGGARRAEVEAARARYAAVQARYRGGLASLFELEDARRNAVQARSALLGLQRERSLAWVQLYRALGGGSDGAGNGA